MLHGCTVEDEAFIGMGATVLDGAVVEKNAMVAAGAHVRQNTRIPFGEVCGRLKSLILPLLGFLRMCASSYMGIYQLVKKILFVHTDASFHVNL